jgi:DNA-binding transcriptional regulator YiaG
MIQSEETGYASTSWGNRKQFAGLSDTMLGFATLVDGEPRHFPTGGSYGRYAPIRDLRPDNRMEYVTTSDDSVMSGLRAAGIIVVLYLVSNGDARAQAVPTTPSKQIIFSSNFAVGESEGHVDQHRLTLGADLIGKIRQETGLTLELIAPLLGVSRRTIQSWKAGGEISLKNEERLRELAEAIGRLPSGSPGETKNLLLERIPGSIRIYDLLAERRFGDAIARAHRLEKPEPIYSDPSIVYQHPSIGSQLAITEDVSLESAGQLNRKVSRRLKL